MSRKYVLEGQTDALLPMHDAYAPSCDDVLDTGLCDFAADLEHSALKQNRQQDRRCTAGTASLLTHAQCPRLSFMLPHCKSISVIVLIACMVACADV